MESERKKKAGVSVLVSDKTDFKLIKIKKDKEGHYTLDLSQKAKGIL